MTTFGLPVDSVVCSIELHSTKCHALSRKDVDHSTGCPVCSSVRSFTMTRESSSFHSKQLPLDLSHLLDNLGRSSIVCEASARRCKVGNTSTRLQHHMNFHNNEYQFSSCSPSYTISIDSVRKYCSVPQEQVSMCCVNVIITLTTEKSAFQQGPMTLRHPSRSWLRMLS